MAKVSNHPSAIQTMTVINFFCSELFFGIKTTEIPLWKDAALYLLTNIDMFPTLLEIGVVLTRGWCVWRGWDGTVKRVVEA